MDIVVILLSIVWFVALCSFSNPIMAMLVIGTSIWAYFDSKNVREFGDHPFGVWISCILLWIICFPVYLARRSGWYDQKRKSEENKNS